MFNFKLKKIYKIEIAIFIICAFLLITFRMVGIYYANRLLDRYEAVENQVAETQAQLADEYASRINIENYQNPHESNEEILADTDESSADSEEYKDNNLEDSADADNEADTNSSGSNKVSLTFGMWADIYEDEGELSFYVANPSKSQKNVSIAFYLDELLLGESGIIKPGYEIQTVDISEAIEESGVDIASYFEEETEYEGYMLISYYDPETGVKEKVNTEIPLTMYIN